jgi:hypothetical protein
MRRCILSGGVAQAQKYHDIPAPGRRGRQAAQQLKCGIYFRAAHRSYGSSPNSLEKNREIKPKIKGK